MRGCDALRPLLVAVVVLGAAVACVRPGAGQSQGPTDSLRLGALQQAAARADPRWEGLQLREMRTNLRLNRLRAEVLPAVGLHSRGQYQSDVASIPFQLPGGASPPVPPRDSYDAYLSLRQTIYDPSVAPRRRLEESRLEEEQAGVHASLYELRDAVNEAFFSALLLRTQRLQVEAAIASLQEQVEVASERVREGAALPSEAATVRRALLTRQQQVDDLRSRESAARRLLEELTGVGIEAGAVLEAPDLEWAVAAAREQVGELRSRPEFERFARARQVLEVQSAALRARERPRISAFARGGYGRPGLNPLATAFDTYWLGGVQMDWTPWDRGAVGIEQEELAVQRALVATEEAAFAREIERRSIIELASIEQLELALERDDEIIALGEEIVGETRLRYEEAVVTSTELLDREAELLDAHLVRSSHVVQLARARARFLTLIGYDLP